MKTLILVLVSLTILTTFASAVQAVSSVNGYTKRNGTYVSGHYRDTSNDGNEYNNANYLGYNN